MAYLHEDKHDSLRKAVYQMEAKRRTRRVARKRAQLVTKKKASLGRLRQRYVQKKGAVPPRY